jgi:hypothetical protein
MTREVRRELARAGFRFDPFADARMGRSLFQMQPEDWLVPMTEKEREAFAEEGKLP